MGLLAMDTSELRQVSRILLENKWKKISANLC